MIAQIELQKAIYSTLSESFNVTEIKSTEPVFPFIELGNIIERNVSNAIYRMGTFNVTIHTFSKGYDSTESKTLNEYVKSKMLQLENVNGFNLDYVKLDSITNLNETETDGTVFHGVLFFNVHLTELK